MQVPSGDGLVERSCRISMLLGKAHLNPDFRKRLQTDFHGVAKEFHLSKHETDGLKSVDWTKADDPNFLKGNHLGGLQLHHFSWDNLKDAKRLGDAVYGIAVCV